MGTFSLYFSKNLYMKYFFVFKLFIKLLNIQCLYSHITYYVRTHGILSSVNWEPWNYFNLYCLKVWSYWNQSKVWSLCFLLSLKEVLTGGTDFWLLTLQLDNAFFLFFPHCDCHPVKTGSSKWQKHIGLLDVESGREGSWFLLQF